MSSIADIERSIDVVNFLEYIGVDFCFEDGLGTRFACPIHKESNRQDSALIYRDTRFFRCFASNECSNGTSIPLLQFIMNLKGLVYKEARKWLENYSGQKVDFKNLKNNKNINQVKYKELKEPEFNYKIEEKYHKWFNEASVCYTEYLQKRNISQSTSDYFNIRYRKNSWMKGRIVFPVYDDCGEIKAYSGRIIDENLIGTVDKNGKIVAKYYNAPRGVVKSSLLYNMHRIKNSKYIIITEGFPAVWRLHQLKFPAVAIMGSSISVQQMFLIRKFFKNKDKFFFYDGDIVGRNCGKQSYELARKFMKKNYVIKLFNSKDPDFYKNKNKIKKLLEEVKGDKNRVYVC